MKINRKKLVSWLLVILWMALIFHLSHQPVEVSRELSKGVTEKIVEVVEKIEPNKEFNLSRANHLLRKSAHFFSYFFLGIFLASALRKSGLSGYKLIGIAVLISVLYAISDEVHQLFVPGRGGQFKDVIIDSSGAIVGIVVYKFVGMLRSKIN